MRILPLDATQAQAFSGKLRDRLGDERADQLAGLLRDLTDPAKAGDAGVMRAS